MKMYWQPKSFLTRVQLILSELHFDSVNIDFTLDGDISVKNALENRK